MASGSRGAGGGPYAAALAMPAGFWRSPALHLGGSCSPTGLPDVLVENYPGTVYLGGVTGPWHQVGLLS